MNIDRKRESFRMQIRRRGLDFDFKLKRKDETPVTPQQAVPHHITYSAKQ